MATKPQTRTKILTFRLTPDEFRRLARQARAAGLTPSQWCRARCVPAAEPKTK